MQLCLNCAQVLISTFARQENVGRAIIYEIKCRLESGGPRDSLSSVEAEACKRPHSSQETLKASIRAAWANMSKDYIIKTRKVFQPQLEAMIEVEGWPYTRPKCLMNC